MREHYRCGQSHSLRTTCMSATTDQNGEATLAPPPQYRDSNHAFEARFEGDDYFISSCDRSGN